MLVYIDEYFTRNGVSLVIRLRHILRGGAIILRKQCTRMQCARVHSTNYIQPEFMAGRDKTALNYSLAR